MFLSITSYNLYNPVKREKNIEFLKKVKITYEFTCLFSIGFNSGGKNLGNLCKPSTMKMFGILPGKQNIS